jgi:hypothetical protein
MACILLWRALRVSMFYALPALIAVSASARAADMAVKVPPAPIVGAPYNWSGF